MQSVVYAFVILIALEHIVFLVLEMFLWIKPIGQKIFEQTKEEAEVNAVLAANQGLYNGFLAAGLLWGVVHPNTLFGMQIITFFLVCIVIAGIYGGIIANRKIIYLQAVPAMIILLLVGVSM